MYLYVYFLLIAINYQMMLNGGIKIYETDDLAFIQECVQDLSSNDLVLFDIDDTLIVAVDEILKPINDCFFDLLTNYTENDLDLWHKIHLQAPQTLVDKRSVTLIAQLQRMGITTLAFTAAYGQLPNEEAPCDWRITELSNFGYDFSSALPQVSFIELPLLSSQSEHLPMYKSGILFSACHPKGITLHHFLEKIGWLPNRIVFIDDVLKNVLSVTEAMNNIGVDCIGIHYKAAYSLLSKIDIEQARNQIHHFLNCNDWISDKEWNKSQTPLE
ncbi:MAG: DUF2608 domain-containing protein [Parachlamydiaceae bacterium]